MNKIEKVILSATALAFAGVVAFIVFGKSIERSLQPKVMQITYQFLLIVVAGGGVSWLYRELTRIREKEDTDRTELLEMYSDLVKAYNSTKKIRRLLRARAIRKVPDDKSDDTERVQSSVYEEQMENLIDVQLEFESYKRNVKGRNKLFSKIPHLHKWLKSIESYLHDIIDEYEKALVEQTKRPDFIPLVKLPHLAEFIAPKKESKRFRSNFEDPFKEALEKLSLIASK